VINKVKTTYASISSHLQDHRRGEILRDGCRIAILGAPNAGKVKLFNKINSNKIFIFIEFIIKYFK
jgi:tRNA modification GTPase